MALRTYEISRSSFWDTNHSEDKTKLDIPPTEGAYIKSKIIERNLGYGAISRVRTYYWAIDLEDLIEFQAKIETPIILDKGKYEDLEIEIYDTYRE